MSRSKAIKYFHYCNDPPAKCAVKKHYINKYRNILGINNTTVIQRDNAQAALSLRKIQLDSLLRLALYKQKRVRTQASQAQCQRLIRTSQIVKRGVASFNKTNQQDLHQQTPFKFIGVRKAIKSVFIDHISRPDIGDDVSTIKKVSQKFESQNADKQLIRIIGRYSSVSNKQKQRKKPWSANIRVERQIIDNNRPKTRQCKQ